MDGMVDDRAGEFFAAIHRGDHARVAELLRGQPSLAHANDEKSFGATTLIAPAGRGDLRMIDLLIDAGADPNRRSDWWAGGFLPIDDADAATVDHLLARGATLTPHAAARLGRADELRAMISRRPECVHERGGDGQLPLHFAANVEIASTLLHHGADIEAKDLDHASTAAQWLAPARPAVAAYLVSRGALVDLFMACMIDDVARAEALATREPAGIMARITAERFPAPGSSALGIYHYTVGTGCTPLHAAAISGAAGACRWLIARGADVAATGGYDDATPLHHAAWHNQPAAARAILDGGAPIDQPSGPRHRNSPLGWAIVAGAPEVVEVLLSGGARIEAVHRQDAEEGTRGAFRMLKKHTPIAHWTRVQQLIEAKR